VKGRLQRKPARHGSVFIDDTYNANPDSVKAALAVLAHQQGKRVLVLGDMGELGDDATALHAEIGLAARAAGTDRLLALGDLSRATVGAFGAGATHFERIEELLAELENALDATTTVLVKGSRFMKMERVVNRFMEYPAASPSGHETH
jgi:UDP-N-acetylmuramoyl-tripeptide--D-alanyl-D-alanine ligase